MIHLSEKEERYIPEIGIIVYRRNGERGVNELPSHYLESHKFSSTTNGSFQMEAGIPLKESTLSGLHDFLISHKKESNRQMEFKGLIPPEVLHVQQREGDAQITWIQKARKKRLLFSEELAIPSGETWLPNLLFKATKKSISVWALKSHSCIGANTKLFHAPFHNVSEDGQVCMGMVRRARQHLYIEDFIEEWTNLFFNSYFTHLHRTTSPIKGNINAIWSALIGSSQRFPNTELLPAKIELQNIL